MRHTEALHLRAERTGFVNDLLRRQASRTGYVLFLRNLAPAYQALEQGLARHAEAPAFAPFDWPPLYREAALQADMTALAGAGWAEAVALLPAGRRYGQAVAAAAEGDGAGLLGHAYARYLGDLSGGQILKTILRRAPGLPAEALSFYEFPAVADASACKDRFRAGLDQAADHVAPAAVLAAAALAFELNIALSLAVQAELAAPA
jgi:heme oxygenase